MSKPPSPTGHRRVHVRGGARTLPRALLPPGAERDARPTRARSSSAPGAGSPLTPPTPTFADVPPAGPFYGYIERAVAQGVLSGYSCGGAGEPCPGRYFRPAANSTRGQLSKILYNMPGRA